MAISERLALTRQLLSLMESTPALTIIDFSCSDVQIRLSGHAASAHEGVTSPPNTVPPSPAASAKPATPPDVTVITEALHGFFYHSPSPGAAPLQRRHQKVIEESPAPGVASDAIRRSGVFAPMPASSWAIAAQAPLSFSMRMANSTL